MGRLKRIIADFIEKTASRRVSRKKLLLSIVSLVLAVMILCTATFCWYMLISASGGTDDSLVLDAGNGLRVNDLGNNFKDITDTSFLVPASSVDGRNLYFPTDGTDFSNVTDSMSFRSANAGDMNVNYIQLTFELSAEADYTSIYLDKATSITIDGSESNAGLKNAEKAIRSAIYYEGIEKNKPIVFSTMNKSRQVKAVKEVDRITGKFLETATQTAVPFKDYFYGKKQIASLNRGETRRFSLLIWLEGTDSYCTSDPIRLKQLNVNLILKTSWDDLTPINFVDKTDGTSIETLMAENKSFKMVLDYNDDAHKIDHYEFTLYKSSEDPPTWTCSVPSIAYNDLVFKIVNSASDDEVVAYWDKRSNGNSTKNRMTADTYYADTYTQSSSVSSYGHWYDSEIEGGGIGVDIGELGDDDW